MPGVDVTPPNNGFQRLAADETLASLGLSQLKQCTVGTIPTMSKFACICGTVTREADEPSGTSGIWLSLSELARVEERIASIVVEYMLTSPEHRNSWLAAQLGAQYPSDQASHEVAADLVSLSVNEAAFSSTFSCPACGRLALAGPTEQSGWRFFKPE